MSNPFEQKDSAFLVLVNAEEQYSLWPAPLGVPAGWTAVLGPASHDQCVGHIETHWTDMRPRSLRVAMQDAATSS